jgi:hypothetical protein
MKTPFNLLDGFSDLEYTKNACQLGLQAERR